VFAGREACFSNQLAVIIQVRKPAREDEQHASCLPADTRNGPLELNASYPAFAVDNSLCQSVETVQLLVQAGVGFVTGRVDFNLRYEQRLTPYSRRFVYDGNSYGYRQQIR
jgi:hypothetical protein